jgi:hypothetical protein
LSDIAIRVDNVSKRYRITHQSKKDDLRELISAACRSVFRRERRGNSTPDPSKVALMFPMR